jgi:alpha-D-ribose 1-methylphosphonate 5-triphosphate synthase subunit PhnG
VDLPARAAWMTELALAPVAELERAWAALDPRPAYRVVRRADVGLVMVRGRAGGTGVRFNLGEMTVARCTVEVNGIVGHALVGGADGRHAELAAVFDALLQDAAHRPALAVGLVEPLAERRARRRRESLAQTAATRVDFFTMVRGED